MNDNQVITIVKIPKLLRNFIYQFKIRVSPVWAQIKVELKGIKHDYSLNLQLKSVVN